MLYTVFLCQRCITRTFSDLQRNPIYDDPNFQMFLWNRTHKPETYCTVNKILYIKKEGTRADKQAVW